MSFIEKLRTIQKESTKNVAIEQFEKIKKECLERASKGFTEITVTEIYNYDNSVIFKVIEMLKKEDLKIIENPINKYSLLSTGQKMTISWAVEEKFDI